MAATKTAPAKTASSGAKKPAATAGKSASNAKDKSTSAERPADAIKLLRVRTH